MGENNKSNDKSQEEQKIADFETITEGPRGESTNFDIVSEMFQEVIEDPLITGIGNYEIIEELGSGGMGKVYLAKPRSKIIEESTEEKIVNEALEEISQQGIEISEEIKNNLKTVIINKFNSTKKLTQINQSKKVDKIPDEVALKTLSINSPEYRKRFEREFNITHALRNNPGVVDVFEFGQDKEQLFYSMEYLPRKVSKSPSIEEAIDIIKSIGETLEITHSEGIIHRDLKPDNIGVREIKDDEEVMADEYILLDFGIGRDARMTTMTLEDTVAGTPQYMSPEQARGDIVDGRTDIYALGVILEKWVTGKYPTYEIGLYGDEENCFRDINHMKAFIMSVGSNNERDYLPSENKKIDKNLEAIILKATAKEKEERYRTCGELVSDIKRFNNGEKVNSYDWARRYKIKRRWGRTWEKYKKPLIGMGLAASITLASWLGFDVYNNSQGKGRLEDLEREVASLELRGDTRTLLENENKLILLIEKTKSGQEEYKGRSYEGDFIILEDKIKEKQKEINSTITNSAIKELKDTDPLSDRADELYEIILTNLFEGKIKSIDQSLPRDKFPKLVNKTTGKWSFTDESVEPHVGPYPANLLLGYEIAGDEYFKQRFVELSDLVKEGRKSTNTTTSEFFDVFLTSYQMYKLSNNKEYLTHFLDETQKLLTRFRGEYDGDITGVGDFFQSVGRINDVPVTANNIMSLGYISDVLITAYEETGDLIYYDLYSKQMETFLKLLREEGGIYQSMFIVQAEEWYSKNLGNTYYAGDIPAKTQYMDWRNPKDGRSTTGHAIAILGFLNYYKQSNDERFLREAKNIAEFMIENMEENMWPWRFDADKEYEKGTNGTVLIGSALLELSLYENDFAKRREYETLSKKILHNLVTNYLDFSKEYDGILRNSYSIIAVSSQEADAETDFYFISYMKKYLDLKKLKSKFERREFSIGNEERMFSGFRETGSGKLMREDRTLVRARYDEHNLYFVLDNFYRENLEKEDIEIIIDVPGDDKSFYSFRFSNEGEKREVNEGASSRDVNWDVTIENMGDRWISEIVIPLNEIPGIETKVSTFNIYRKGKSTSSLGYAEEYFRNTDTAFKTRESLEVIGARLKLVRSD